MTLSHVVSVSGGKDSTALYLRAIERGLPFRAVFADTGNEHEWTYDFVRELPGRTGGPEIEWVKADFTDRIAKKRDYIAMNWPREIPQVQVDRAVALLRPTGNPFVDLCLWKTRFPSAKARFCTDMLKIEPMYLSVHRPALIAGNTLISWQGVRADESRARSMLPRFQWMNPVPYMMPAAEQLLGKAWHAFVYRPLINWTEQDVFAYHDRHGVRRNPLYDHRMKRVGCMPCVMCGKEEIRAISELFPEHIDKIERWEALMSEVSKKANATFFNICDDPILAEGWQKPDYDWSLSRTGIRSRVEWSKTSHGGRQYDAFLAGAEAFGTSCNQWGACE